LLFKASSFISRFAFSTDLRSRLALCPRLHSRFSSSLQDVAPRKPGRGLQIPVCQPTEDPAEPTLQFGGSLSALNLLLPPAKTLFDP